MIEQALTSDLGKSCGVMSQRWTKKQARVGHVAMAGALMTIVLLLCAQLASAAPAAGIIAGTIADTGGVRIAGARIVLRSSARRYDVISDRGGDFALADVELGVYGIDATAAGFAPATGHQITVTAGTMHVALSLARATASGVASLGSVTVNGTSALSRASAPTIEINPQALAAAGVVQLSDILGQQLAVTMVRQGGGAPGLPQSAALRGPDPSETIVDIDGHQVNNQNTGDYELELLDPAEFAGVQIVYGVGPSSLIGADSEGGAINFRTIEPTQTTHALMRVTFGTFNTGGLTIEATGTDERIGYAALYRSLTTQGQVYDYPITIATPGPGTPAQTAVVGSSITGTITLAKLRYSLANNAGFIEASFRDTAAVRDLSAPLSAPDDPNDTAPYAPFTAVNAPGATVLTASPAYSLDAQLPLGRKSADGLAPATLTLQHLTNISNQSVENISPTLNPYLLNDSDRVDDEIAQYERAPLGPANGTLTFVADYRWERLTAPDAFAPGPPTQYAIERWIVGRYTWNPSEYLHYTAAAYYSVFSTFGTSFDPRFAIVWTPPNSVVRASIGTGFRAPLLTELAFNPALQVERSVNEELGYERRFGAGLFATRGSLNAYHTLVNNAGFMTIAADGQLTFLGNIGPSVYQGVEIRADQPVSPTVALHAAWGVNSACPRVDPVTINPAAPPLIPGQQYMGIPLHKAQLTLDRQAAPAGLSYALTGTYASAGNELNAGEYLLVDASIGMTFGHTDISLRAANLTNQFDHKFTFVGAGVPYPVPGGTTPTDAYALQGRTVGVTVTQRI
jgi:outer membrane cobalamin receptor